MSNYISSLHGVEMAKGNPATGRILVIFDEKHILEETIEDEIDNFINGENRKQKEPLLKRLTNVSGNKDINRNVSSINSSYPFHAMNAAHIEKILKTDFKKGLSSKFIEEKYRKYGLNEITKEKKNGFFSYLREGLKDICVKVLLASSVVSLFLGQFLEAVALGSIVLFQVGLGAVQKSKSEISLDALQNMLVQKSTVIRNGIKQEIDAKYLVPGDIIQLKSGDKVPADARILSCQDLKINESSLTGESVGVYKNNKSCKLDTDVGSRHNMLYMGTTVLSGVVRAVVVSTGRSTEIGKIANMLDTITEESTQLENMAESFITKLIKAYLIFFGIFSSIALLSGRGFAQVLMMGVTFFLGAIPEGLPVTVTTCMVLSVRRMAKKNAIVRRMSAVENLGKANVICCDKTGTLTLNEMTVREIYTNGCVYKVTGSGYSPIGNIEPIEEVDKDWVGLDELLKTGVLCNNATLVKKKDKWEIEGDPTEGALLTVAGKRNISTELLKNNFDCVKEVPFESKRMYMLSVVHNKEDDDYRVYCKGSIDKVLEKCSFIYENGLERLLTKVDKEKIVNHCNEMASKGLRTLSFSCKKLQHQEDDTTKDFVFLGFVGMEDPPREGVKESIKKCSKAGIKVIMITGDHIETARAIGKNLNILTNGLVITGNDLERMSDGELERTINDVQVFARTNPEQKYRIVKALKRLGHTVAMTGDGVNDAPAIKEAHIGIAMGMNGSDVARDAACITLVDDDFSTIVAAIEEGRSVIQNIRSTLKYLFAGAIGEMLTIFFAFVLGLPAPFLAVQMIWINLISETLLGSSLAVESPSDNILLNTSIINKDSLFDKQLRNKIFRRGLSIGLSTFAIFKGSILFGASLAKAKTLAFSNFILCQLINVYDSRFSKDRKPSKYMNIMAGISLLSLIGILYIPLLNSIFGTVPLDIISLSGLVGTVLLSRI
ncbi:cation-translocating P-type ATPase [Serpentinicella alkaliphila]|uniref:Ca2+-transporting ATPase n=1 Tax=Serpentinicella alkaliphila TaxID=1734049 RepID=A0A4R2T549_9FIRM|nr:cation-transporting P-type ATPase [Serpentinicella alkaliphila]TCP97175.1 Ca2+-transporting ATPase [Serpentinicella alkaliphila]